MRVQRGDGKSNKNLSAQTSSPWNLALRYLLLMLIDGFGIWFIFNLFIDGFYPVGIGFAVVLGMVNIVLVRQDFYPIRWMLVGLVLMAMLSIYPILFTVYVAFTNFGDGNLLTKTQALDVFETRTYVPEDAVTYSFTAFRSTSSADDFLIWLQPAGGGTPLLAGIDQPLVEGISGENGVGALDDNGIPDTIDGYTRLNVFAASGANLDQYIFGVEPDVVRVDPTVNNRAARLAPQYSYDAATDQLTDLETDIVYTPVDGTFTSPDGQTLIPGYQEIIGLRNFERFFTSPALQGPLLRIVIWNFAFAILSVLTTFAMGLIIALLYNDPKFPGRKIIQSFLLIPYTIPSLITILIWRGMLNPELGVISRAIASVAGDSPPWFTDPTWAKLGILLVNLWLGYPYFMLISSGALQAIPKDIYAAAEVDGANAWQRFWRLTLPLLLVAVGPLLIASFTFNFNNFNVIFLYNGGGPPIVGDADTGRSHGHPDQLCLRPGLCRRARRRLRSRLRHHHRDFPDRGHHHALPVPLHTNVGGGQRKCLTLSATFVASQKAQDRMGLVARWIIALFLMLFAVFPVIWIVSASFDPTSSLGGGSLIPRNAGLDNYREPLEQHHHPLPALDLQLAEDRLDHHRAFGADHHHGRLCLFPLPLHRPAEHAQGDPADPGLPRHAGHGRPLPARAADRQPDLLAGTEHPWRADSRLPGRLDGHQHLAHEGLLRLHPARHR